MGGTTWGGGLKSGQLSPRDFKCFNKNNSVSVISYEIFSCFVRKIWTTSNSGADDQNLRSKRLIERGSMITSYN